MTYLANMVEDNGVIQNTLSADGFGEERPNMEQWLEYYELNKEFTSYEISNSVYRFCLYVPDEVMYAGNQYYFDGVSRLKERSDYVDLRYALNRGEDYVAISRERDGVDQQDTSQMVTLYHRIASKKKRRGTWYLQHQCFCEIFPGYYEKCQYHIRRSCLSDE